MYSFFQSKLDFETDLYIAQCKIENLEECLSKYKVKIVSLNVSETSCLSDYISNLTMVFN